VERRCHDPCTFSEVSSLNGQRPQGAISEQVEVGPLVVDPIARQITLSGSHIGLTGREFDVFLALLERSGAVVTREAVYDRVWGGRMPHRDRAVDVHVKRLRGKLTAELPQWKFIHTHVGIGYRLVAEIAKS